MSRARSSPSGLPQYSVPRSVRIRESFTSLSSKKGTTRSFKRSAAVIIARALAFELAVRLLFRFGFLQGDDLRLGQNQAFLRDLGFQRFQPFLHRFEIMPHTDAP